MRKNELIVIVCKTDAPAIFDLIVHEFKIFFGKENVNDMIFNMFGDMDDRIEVFFKYALKSKKPIQIVRGEGDRVYNEQLCLPFAKKLKNRGIKYYVVFDTSTEELLYSGSILRGELLKQVIPLRELINGIF